ncbi:hypothetical protein WOLCODRAFT_161545 [Wolfiporia cocos MD-104 SS10]|uniref:Uncharacterized protein n=1 Tax=Wolfiporia cocos (strain MD-104) TaxID=742152 RepID=A0A2H3JP42_WOLCO|nr:hypothetical protein WOLCODRAFT_161545 [Wolfiporia cocos MD-104 SS10]
MGRANQTLKQGWVRIGSRVASGDAPHSLVLAHVDNAPFPSKERRSPSTVQNMVGQSTPVNGGRHFKGADTVLRTSPRVIDTLNLPPHAQTIIHEAVVRVTNTGLPPGTKAMAHRPARRPVRQASSSVYDDTRRAAAPAPVAARGRMLARNVTRHRHRPRCAALDPYSGLRHPWMNACGFCDRTKQSGLLRSVESPAQKSSPGLTISMWGTTITVHGASDHRVSPRTGHIHERPATPPASQPIGTSIALKLPRRFCQCTLRGCRTATRPYGSISSPACGPERGNIPREDWSYPTGGQPSSGARWSQPLDSTCELAAALAFSRSYPGCVAPISNWRPRLRGVPPLNGPAWVVPHCAAFSRRRQLSNLACRPLSSVQMVYQIVGAQRGLLALCSRPPSADPGHTPRRKPGAQADDPHPRNRHINSQIAGYESTRSRLARGPSGGTHPTRTANKRLGMQLISAHEEIVALFLPTNDLPAADFAPALHLIVHSAQ